MNAATGLPDVLLVSFPTYLAGRVSVENSTQVWGAEGGPMVNLFRSCPDELSLWNVNLISGFRYLDVHEQLRIDQSSTLVGNSTAAFDGLPRDTESFGQVERSIVREVLGPRRALLLSDVGARSSLEHSAARSRSNAFR